MRELALANALVDNKVVRDRRHVERPAARDQAARPLASVDDDARFPRTSAWSASRPRPTSIPPTAQPRPRCTPSRCWTRWCASSSSSATSGRCASSSWPPPCGWGRTSCPATWADWNAVCARLDLPERYDLYLTQFPITNAAAIGAGTPMVMVNSRTIEVLDELEVRTVLGHEAGHILSDHVLYRTALIILVSTQRRRPAAGARRAAAARRQVRAARVVPRGRAVVRPRRHARHARPAGHLPHDARAGGRDAVAQARPRRVHAPGDGVRGRGTRAGTASTGCPSSSALTHSFPVRRVKEVMTWVRSGDYDRILGGEFTTARPGGRPAQGGRGRRRLLHGALPRLPQGRRGGDGQGRRPRDRRGRPPARLAPRAAAARQDVAQIARTERETVAPRDGLRLRSPAPSATTVAPGTAHGDPVPPRAREPDGRDVAAGHHRDAAALQTPPAPGLPPLDDEHGAPRTGRGDRARCPHLPPAPHLVARQAQARAEGGWSRSCAASRPPRASRRPGSARRPCPSASA